MKLEISILRNAIRHNKRDQKQVATLIYVFRKVHSQSTESHEWRLEMWFILGAE